MCYTAVTVFRIVATGVGGWRYTYMVEIVIIKSVIVVHKANLTTLPITSKLPYYCRTCMQSKNGVIMRDYG